ncbi:glycosyltransferase [Lyngbya aestuarii]|uniref:glycosyltransferase n=1 Tax=Lyngbya aestuarii TaxID=118322 RepID=UPI00403D8AEC
MSITASILIRTKNEARDLPKALDIIRNQSLKPVDIIVVDSGSTDGTVDIVKQQSEIKLIQMLPEEFTFGSSLNIGFEAAQGEVVVSLSAHAFPCDQHWLQNLVKHFDDPQVAGVYGKQVPQPDAWPPVQRDYLSYYRDQLRVQNNLANFSDHSFSNANSAIRFQSWKRRPFNETLTGAEDREWARIMLDLGYKIVYEPKAALYHSHNEPFLKVYQRTYREALAHEAIYEKNERKIGLGAAFQRWYKSVVADVRFIIRNGKNYIWLLKAPIYRLFWTYGYLRPNMPDALWEPFVKRWKRIISLETQKW